MSGAHLLCHEVGHYYGLAQKRHVCRRCGQSRRGGGIRSRVGWPVTRVRSAFVPPPGMIALSLLGCDWVGRGVTP